MRQQIGFMWYMFLYQSRIWMPEDLDVSNEQTQIYECWNSNQNEMCTYRKEDNGFWYSTQNPNAFCHSSVSSKTNQKKHHQRHLIEPYQTSDIGTARHLSHSIHLPTHLDDAHHVCILGIASKTQAG